MIEAIARMVGVEVRQAEAGFTETLARLPLAQKRTSKNKAYVHVGPDAICKGPYSSTSLKLVNNLRYPHLIHLLEDGLKLPPAVRGVYCWATLFVCRNGEQLVYYLGGPNVGRPERMQVEDAATLVDPAFRVVNRGTLLRRVSEIEKVKVGSRWRRHPDFDRVVAVASLQHLYLRHLFNVGDSGTHNILVREDRHTTGHPVAGIDFDEHRREGEGKTLWDCFFKGNHGYLEEIYGELVPRIVLVEALDPVVLAGIAELNALTGAWAVDAVIRVEDVQRRNEHVHQLLVRCDRKK